MPKPIVPDHEQSTLFPEDMTLIKESKVKADCRNKKVKSTFDRSSSFSSRIAPEIEKLINLCVLNEIPIFIAACPASDAKSSTYKFAGVSGETFNYRLANDFFGKMICVMKGFDTVQPIDESPDEYDPQNAEAFAEKLFGGK